MQAEFCPTHVKAHYSVRYVTALAKAQASKQQRKDK